MPKQNAESEESTARGQENAETSDSTNSRRKGRTGTISRTDGDIGSGTTGEIGSGNHSFADTDVAGGVIEQLIIDAEDRLKVARECIDWYKREEETALARLDNLEKLREVAERQKQKNQHAE